MNAKEIMSENPACVTPDSSVRDAAKLMRTEDVGLIPVVEDEQNRRLVGVITDRDIALRIVGDGMNADASVRDIMSKQIHTAKPDDAVDTVMDTMGREQVRRVPIVDERGSLVGIIAQADIVRDAPNDKRAERTVEKISKPGRN